jgi:hypothetical protein
MMATTMMAAKMMARIGLLLAGWPERPAWHREPSATAAAVASATWEEPSEHPVMDALAVDLIRAVWWAPPWPPTVEQPRYAKHEHREAGD